MVDSNAVEVREITSSDVDYMENMMSFYGISESEAYERFIVSNFGEVDVVSFDPDDYEVN